ncbi:MAG: hypothetical protein VB124_03970 [Burkholderia sp.]
MYIGLASSSRSIYATTPLPPNRKIVSNPPDPVQRRRPGDR